MALQKQFLEWLNPVWNPKACLNLPAEQPPVFEPPEALLSRLSFQLRKKLKDASAGQHQSFLRGQGLAFNQLRPYLPGDDIRKIDWNVFARTLTPYIKEYQEEKQLTLWLAIDLTPSMFLGQRQAKALKVIEWAGLLGLLGQQEKHRLGLFCFTGQETIILPPSASVSQLHRILKVLQDQCHHRDRQAFAVAPDFFHQACQELQHVVARRATIFFFSDFIQADRSQRWEYPLGELSRHCTMLYFLVEDPMEQALPETVGLCPCIDPEGGADPRHIAWIDTQDPKQREAYRHAYRRTRESLCKRLSKLGQALPVSTEEESFQVLWRACQGAPVKP